jgi:hypothetical protein
MVLAALLLFGNNDANWVAFGGAGAFAPHKTIHMLGEDINITVYDEKIHVRVYFSFENRGPATTVKMAFPFEGTQYDSRQQLLRFATKVDGAAVRVEKVTIAPITQSGKNFIDQGIDLPRPFALVKEVAFDSGQTRAVLVDYVTMRGWVGSSVGTGTYILHTGATWAGKIGQCTVTVDWSTSQNQGKPDMVFLKSDYSEVASEWHFTSPRIATTTLTNIEPDFDLDLSSIEGYGHVTLNGKTHGSVHGAAIHDRSFFGPPHDPLIRVDGLYDFFTDDYDDGRDRMIGPVADFFGNRLSVSATGTSLIDGKGKSRLLKRKAFVDEYDSLVVRLRDVVEALGGTFKWVPEWERIDITMPTAKR